MADDLRSKIESISVKFSFQDKDSYFLDRCPYIDEEELKKIGQEIERAGLSRWQLVESTLAFAHLTLPHKEIYLFRPGVFKYTDKTEAQEVDHVSLANITEHGLSILRRTSLKEKPFKNALSFEFSLQDQFKTVTYNSCLFSSIREELLEFGKGFFHREVGLLYDAQDIRGKYNPLHVHVTPKSETLKLYK